MKAKDYDPNSQTTPGGAISSTSTIVNQDHTVTVSKTTQ